MISHKNPLQLEHLLWALSSSCRGSATVLHHDPRGPLLSEKIKKMDGVVIAPSPQPTYWADWSQVSAMIACLRPLLDAQPHVDWCVLLSGQDYPIRPLEDLQRSLSEARVDAFIDAKPVTADSDFSEESRIRYDYRWKRSSANVPWNYVPRRYISRFNVAQSRIILRTRTPSGHWFGWHRRPAPSGEITIYKGSQWMTLGRRAALRIVEAYEEGVLGWFANSMIPDEAWVHTLLFNDPSFQLADYSHHFVRFSGAGVLHPDILGAADIPEMSASGKYFARKFDEKMPSSLLAQLDELCGVATAV